MISRVLRVLCFSALSVRVIVPAQVPLNDTPPTLSLPPLPSLTPAAIPAGTTAAPPATVAPSATPKPAPSVTPNNPTSTTADGQFTIHGTDLATRTWFSTQCENVAGDLRRLLRDPAPYGIPIVVSLRTAPNISLTEQAVTTGVRELLNGGFHLQVTVQLRPDFNSNDLRTELIRVLLAERILRDHQQLTALRRPALPVWFFTGVTEALRYRERARPSATFAVVFKTGKVFGIEEILGAAPTSMDALSRTIYETSACALVLMLLDQPEGNMRMAKFLSALATDSRSDREVLNQWFPGLAQSKSSLDKWWSLQMAHMARPTVWETLDPQETVKALELALAFHYEGDAEYAGESRRVLSKSADNDGDESVKVTEEEKRSFFGKLFGGSKKEGDETGTAKIEKPKPEKKPAPEVDDKPPSTNFLSRMFGGGDAKSKDAASEEKKPEVKKEELKQSEATTAPTKSEPKKAEPKKPESKPTKTDIKTAPTPGILRRLFSGGDKTDLNSKVEPKPKPEARKNEEPAKSEAKPDNKKPSALVMPLLMRMLADITMPNATAVFDAQQALVASTPRVIAITPLFERKKADPEEQAKKEKEAEEKKKKDDAKKAEAAKRNEVAKQAAVKKAEARKAKSDKQPETKKEEPKAEPKKDPVPVPKPAAKKRKVMVSVPIEDFAKILKRPDAKPIMAATVGDLAALAQRAHPLFQSIINDYITFIAGLATGNIKDAEGRVKKLRERTTTALKQARAVQEHVDWFEAENSKWSGTFDDFLRLGQTIKDEMPKRADELSRLLDEAERRPGSK